MLALITSRLQNPVEEAVDRDPGFITLAVSLLRAVARIYEAGFRRQCELIGESVYTIH